MSVDRNDHNASRGSRSSDSDGQGASSDAETQPAAASARRGRGEPSTPPGPDRDDGFDLTAGGVAESGGTRRRRGANGTLRDSRRRPGRTAGAAAADDAEAGPVRPLWVDAVRYALIFVVFVLLHMGWDYVSASRRDSSLQARRAAMLRESCPPGVDCAQALSDP